MNENEIRQVIEALDKCLLLIDDYADSAEAARKSAADAKSLLLAKIPRP